MSDERRHIPSVHVLVEHVMASGRTTAGRGLITVAARSVVEDHRRALANGGAVAPASVDELTRRVQGRITDEARSPLPAAINATGIILHTGLGRAPLADAAVRAMIEAAGYTPVEFELESGGRGRRTRLVRSQLMELTGAESATVVNNGAGALVLALASVAAQREVVVSRGELIEIGGSFRLPDIMAASGAILREVGTTNRTRDHDFEDAIGPDTAALLKVHPSNYRIEGFHEAVEIEALVEIGARRGCVVMHDIGSGALAPVGDLDVIMREPQATRSIVAGADLVLFSGDKLLGGPQAGIIVGKTLHIDAIERHPLMRALRVDKITLAALAATLQLHRDADGVCAELPVFAMLSASVTELAARARRLVAAVSKIDSVSAVWMSDSVAHLGGGTLPTEAVPSCAVVVRSRAIGEDVLARRLRTGEHPVVARTHAGSLWLDLRTIRAKEDTRVVSALVDALSLER